MTIRYVAKQCPAGGSPCSDANNGLSRATAKLTIAAIAATTVGGDTVVMGEGNWNEIINNLFPSGIDNNNHTTIIAEFPPTSVRGTRNTIISGGNGFSSVVQVINRSFITFEGFKVDCINSIVSGVAFGDSGVGSGGSHFIRMRNCEITSTGPSGCDTAFGGIINEAETTDLFFQGNYVHHSGNADTQNTFQPHCAYIGKGWTRLLLEDNVYSHNGNPTVGSSSRGGADIHQYASAAGGPGGHIYRRNTFEFGEGAAFSVRDGVNAQIYDNIINGMAQSGGGCAGIVLGYNIEGTVAYHNTIYGGNGAAFCTINTNSVTIRNNIGYLTTNDSVYDGFSTIGGGPPSTNVTQDHNLFGVNPNFTSPGTGDFRITGAPAQGFGTSLGGAVPFDIVGTSFQNPPSAGAYEVSSGLAPGPLFEDFNSYSAGVSINNGAGGTGWTSNWSVANGTVTVENSPAWMSVKSLRINSASYSTAERFCTELFGNLSIQFAMSCTTGQDGGSGLLLYNEFSGNAAAVFFDTSNNIVASSATGSVLLLNNFLTNTKYNIKIEIDTVGHPNKYRVQVDNNVPSAWIDAISAFSGIVGVKAYSSTTVAHTFWLDDISQGLAIIQPNIILMGDCLT